LRVGQGAGRGDGGGRTETAMKASKPGMALALAVALGWSQAGPLMAAGARPAAAAPPHAADAAVARGMSEASPSQQVARALQQMHLTACAAAVQQATDFLFEGQDASFTAQPLGPDADRWPTVFVIESADPAGGHSRFATLMVSPNCSGMYEQVIYWPQPCGVVKSTVFAKYTGEHVLLSEVHVSDAGPALQVYLTPAGTGCVSIKKELFR
jgi:hypothetical protein